MDPQRQAAAHTLRRLRLARGMSWTDLAKDLHSRAVALRVNRIAAAQPLSIRRTIGRWEEGKTAPDEQYQLLLGHLYARTHLGVVAIGPGSDFAELLEALAGFGTAAERLDELASLVAVAVTDTGTSLLAFLGAPLQQGLSTALAAPETLDFDVLAGLDDARAAVNTQIGSVPFVRLHLAQSAIVDACRHLLRGEQSAPVRSRLRRVASTAYALAARLAFETHDDVAALALYDEAVAAAEESDPSRRALIRSSQTMVAYYSTGDVERARRIVDAAVQDARRGGSVLMRARAHALQAEMAARGEPPQKRHAQAALHLAWHDLDGDVAGDPMPGVFSKGRLRGFEGVCGIFLGQEDEAERQLAKSASTLTRPRESVQRAIVLTDRALARLRCGGPGAPEAAAEQLHACVDLTAATRGRVPAQRLRRTRLELRPWRSEAFVADLDDHIHTALIGI